MLAVVKSWKGKKTEHSMEALYNLIGRSRQSMSQIKKRQKSKLEKEVNLVKCVRTIRANHSRMGSRVIYHKLKNPQMGITAFEKMMSSHGLTIPIRKRRIITTQTDRKRRYPNLINSLVLNRINQLVVGDITYYKSGMETYYIFSLKDHYSGRIVGLTGDTNMEGDKALECLFQMSILRRIGTFEDLIHHTDGGGQYRSDDYLNWLGSENIKISQSENCLQNGCAEQLNGVVKNDYLENHDVKDVKDLRKVLKKIKHWINYDRPVAKLGYRTPVNFEEHIESMPEQERPQFKLYDFKEER